MAEPDALELYRDGMAAWSRGELDWVLERTADDFEFHAAQLFPDIQPVYRGKQGLRDFWNQFIVEPWQELEISVERSELTPDGRVLALLQFRGIGRGSGAEVSVEYVHLATFDGELLQRVDGFREWEQAVAAAEAG